MTPGALTDYLAYFQALAAENPDNLDMQLQSRMLLVAAGKDESALQPIAGLTDVENQQIASHLRMMMAIRDRKRDAPDPAEAVKRLSALEMLQQELMRYADLQIPVMKLCRAVDGFGVYDEITRRSFVAGKTHTMIVYCELRNFAAVRDETGMYRTKLDVKLMLHDVAGDVAYAPREIKGHQDVSANRRRDFYITRILSLPATLSSGEYTLKATITDPVANKVQTKSVKISLVKPE